MPVPTTEKRPWIPAPGVAQIEMLYQYLGQMCENVYHVQLNTTGTALTPAQLNSVGLDAEAWEAGHGIGMRNAGSVLQNVVVRDLTVQNGAAVEHTPTAPVTGLGGGTPPPGNVTAAVKWNTAFRGRSFRGRTYHIALPAGYFSGNQLTNAAISDMVARYSTLVNGFTDLTGAKLVVVSYAHNKFWRDVALSTPIVNPTIDVALDSQRRRLQGRGK